MKHCIRFIGLDDSKDSIEVAVAQGGEQGEVRRYGSIANSTEALRKLMSYSWPGNVRELKNFVDRAALLAKGDLIRADDAAFQSDEKGMDAVEDLSLTRWGEAKEIFARRYLSSVLARVGGNISLAARESGMLRQAFQRLLKRHGIDPNEFRGKMPPG